MNDVTAKRFVYLVLSAFVAYLAVRVFSFIYVWWLLDLMYKLKNLLFPPPPRPPSSCVGCGGGADVTIGFFIMVPASFLATWLYIRIAKPPRSALNDLGIFAAMFGILTAFYFLWRL